jgi:DNA-binding XRE family transcriptional regulator
MASRAEDKRPGVRGVTVDQLVDRLRLDPDEIQRRVEELLAEQRAYRLREIREACAWSQQQVADVMGVNQTRVSAIERGDLGKTELATIRRYVEVLGGEIEVVAKIGGERVVLG